MSATSNTPTQSNAAPRSFLWRYLAAAFSYPEIATWEWLQCETTCETLNEALDVVSEGSTDWSSFYQYVGKYSYEEAQFAHLRVFGHTVRGDCPPHELEYGELKADALFQPHRLADIAAFFSAFGLEVANDAVERVDHIAMECEFYSVLCAKEAIAEHTSEEEGAIELCRNAQKQFLREHLGRWTPAFTRRLERLSNHEFFQTHARFLHAAVIAECMRYGLKPGNEDLQLRPAGDLEDPCGACGLANAQFPGAMNPHNAES